MTVTDIAGHFGPYGGRFVPEALTAALDQLDAAFRVAARTIGGTYTTRRHIASPMEPRATMATCRDGRVTLTTTSQFPHITRTVVADALGLSETEVQVVAPHLGGGFGAIFGATNTSQPSRIIIDTTAARIRLR